MKEKLLQFLKKRQVQLKQRQNNLNSSYWTEIQACLEQQVRWFGEICDVMTKVDPPADVWNDTLQKLNRDLEQARKNRGQQANV